LQPYFLIFIGFSGTILLASKNGSTSPVCQSAMSGLRRVYGEVRR
jgi:hypothetical protein